jgi:tetratricopeptide (TPR) repeat protein
VTALAVEPRLPQNQLSRERVRRLLGVTEQKLRSWESLNLVRRCDAYSFADLAKLRKISDISRKRISAARLKKLVSVVAKRERVEDPLSELRIFANDFGVVHLEVAGQRSEAGSGQILLDFEAKPRPNGAAVAFPTAASSAGEDSKKRREAEEWFERGLELEHAAAPESEARAAYEKAIALDPRSTGALVNLGTLYFNARQHSKAEKCYRRAVEVDPSYALAHFNLGNLYDERGEVEKAFRHYAEALRLNPAYPDAHYNLALLFQSRGQSMQALPHWRAYLKLDPRSHWADIARRELGKLKDAAIVK